MPPRLPEETRAEVVRLRVQEALSLTSIAARLELSKSTVQYIVEGIKLPTETVKRLRRMRREVQQENARRLGQSAPHYARQYVLNEEHRREAARRARETSLLYLEHELPLRAKLQARFGQELLKEAFDGAFEGVVLKACGRDVVIDWAQTKAATYKIPARMAVVKSVLDKRRRVAFIPRRFLGSKSAERLKKLRVEVFAIEDILD